MVSAQWLRRHGSRESSPKQHAHEKTLTKVARAYIPLVSHPHLSSSSSPLAPHLFLHRLPLRRHFGSGVGVLRTHQTLSFRNSCPCDLPPPHLIHAYAEEASRRSGTGSAVGAGLRGTRGAVAARRPGLHAPPRGQVALAARTRCQEALFLITKPQEQAKLDCLRDGAAEGDRGCA